MKLNKRLVALASAVLVAGTPVVAQAGIIVVDFEFRFVSAGSKGSFSADDRNKDQFITLDEVTAFSEDYFYRQTPLEHLNGFGSFDIANNVWTPDAPSGYPQWTAWFAWTDNGVQGFVGPEPSYAFNMQTRIVRNDTGPQAVPEPGTLSLFGLGVLGATTLRRRRRG